MYDRNFKCRYMNVGIEAILCYVMCMRFQNKEATETDFLRCILSVLSAFVIPSVLMPLNYPESFLSKGHMEQRALLRARCQIHINALSQSQKAV